MGEEDLTKVFNKDFIEDYKQNLDIIWGQLINLETALFYLERIIAFPHTIFPFKRNTFWNFIEDTLFQECIMIINRIEIDNGRDSISFSQLRKNVIKNIIDDRKKSNLQKSLKELNKRYDLQEIRDKLRIFRTDKVAHLLKKDSISYISETKEQLLTDLINFKKYMYEQFIFLNFDCYRGITLEGHIDTIRAGEIIKKSDTDIDMIIDSIIKNNIVFKMPEEQPDYWECHKSKLSDDDIEIFNEFRVKFKLPKV